MGAATNAGRARAALIAPGGASLCLDYANTRCWRGLERPTETLQRPADLIDWCARAGLLAAPPRSMTPGAAATLFAEAIALREVIYCALSALAAGGSISASDLSVLNAAIARAPRRRRIAQQGGQYAWQVDAPARAAPPSAPQLLAAIVWSAADLIVAARGNRIRQCANDACQWLFLDASRNASRRWCDMSACGNRAKARRHYLKQRQG
ncbi:MAG TPA: ABATE domain-containing protein [Hyphomicrobiaceae bacterium]|nr:ABATE domain-containing protein [Hyphomicrobiaceae bacterium]